MAETSDMVIINQLKQTLNNTLIINNFNLQHPHVRHLSYTLNALFIPLFRAQLPESKAKIIQFPIK